MTTKLLLWLILAILLGWLWFGPWYCCWQQWLCPDCVEGTATEEPTGALEGMEEVVASHAPIEFVWGSAEARTYAGWDSIKNALVAQMEEGKILKITGYYWEGEEAPQGYETMGFARAASLMALLSDSIPAEKMAAASRLMVDPYEEGQVLDKYLFSWEDIRVEVQEAEQPAVEQISTERILFRFATNATKPEDVGPEIQEYLDKVAERVKQTGEKVILIGHTDDRGDEKQNMRLGRKRAETVRRMLRKRGVPSEQIEVRSMGEKDPVASNDTKAGQAENRRVELRIEQQ